jgi:hypothetical protein
MGRVLWAVAVGCVARRVEVGDVAVDGAEQVESGMTSTDGVLAVARQTKRAATVFQRPHRSHSPLQLLLSHPWTFSSRR